MSIYLRLLGGGLMVFSAFLASVEYSSYAQRRLGHYSALTALFSHAGGMISRFLSKGSEIWRGFQNEELEKTGLLSCLRDGNSLSVAFEKCESKLALPKETKEKIMKNLITAGREYKESAAESLFRLAKELEEEEKYENDRLEKSVKVTRALLIGGALAFLIFII